MPQSKALCTAATGPFAELLKISGPTFERYAGLHGWELIVVNEDTAHGRPPPWGKIPILLAALRRFELVAWVDADALIVDDSRDLAAELRRRRDLYLVEHVSPINGETTANTGVFMLRAGRWARDFLTAVWQQTDLIDHRWWENAAAMRLLGYRIDPQPAGRERRTPWLRRVRFLELAWNVMPHQYPCPTPRIIHWGGLPLDERRARLEAEVARLRNPQR
jgi:hypothetical protein